jgi:hypothetical protein
LGKDSIAGVGVGFIGSSSGPSQQGLELCEDLLDRIEIGRVFGEERRRAPTSRIIYDNDRPACACADRVGDEKRRYPVASIGLGAFFARLSAKLDREADASAEGLREFGLAGSRRPVEEKVHAAARRASETSSASYNPSSEIAEIPEMLEGFPGQ